MSSESPENIPDLPTLDLLEELVAEYIGLKLEHVDITPESYVEGVPRTLRDEVLERLQRYESVRSLIPHALEVFKPPPELLGDFKILGEIGRGGAGVVYRAEQISLQRLVALKILPPAAGLSARSVERFLDGAVAAARLAHPNIVSVYTAGETGGILYLAMEYVPGPPLSVVLAALKDIPPEQRTGDDVARILAPYEQQGDQPMELFSRFDPRGRSYEETILRLGEGLADALEACHQQGVLHRDIKPANIILAPDGCPRLMDFGLSRVVGSEPGLTVTGEMLGTPNYLAPEQIDFGLKAASVCGDVYSLGATLYECFAGRPAFVEESLSRLFYRVSSEDPQPLSSCVEGISPRLDRVITTAIAKDPARRHPSPAALREDLRALLFGQEPPFACGNNRGLVRIRSRAGSWKGSLARHRIRWLLSAAVAAVLVAALFIWSPWRVSVGRVQADAPPAGEKAQAGEVNWMNLVRAMSREQLGDVDTARKAFEAFIRRSGESDWALFECGVFHLRHGREKRARTFFRKLQDQCPRSLVLEAWLKLARGKSLSREDLEELVASLDTEAELFERHMLADLASHLGWHEMAIELYDECLRREDHLWIRCERGWAALEAGWREEGVRDLLRVHDKGLWQSIEPRDSRGFSK